jgi:Ca2+-transporting ATPase
VRLKAFSKVLTYIVVGLRLTILIGGLLMGREPFDMLRTSIILAIAAVPEGLLIAVTVICTDKTGALTEGRMRVSCAELLDKQGAWQRSCSPARRNT